MKLKFEPRPIFCEDLCKACSDHLYTKQNPMSSTSAKEKTFKITKTRDDLELKIIFFLLVGKQNKSSTIHDATEHQETTSLKNHDLVCEISIVDALKE